MYNVNWNFANCDCTPAGYKLKYAEHVPVSTILQLSFVD